METIIVSIIGALSVISTTLIQTFTAKKTNKIEENFVKTNQKIDSVKEELKTEIDNIAISSIKNFLVRTLGEIEQGEHIDETVRARLYEEYDKYVKEYHQNSYIHTKWEKLRKEGKL